MKCYERALQAHALELTDAECTELSVVLTTVLNQLLKRKKREGKKKKKKKKGGKKKKKKKKTRIINVIINLSVYLRQETRRLQD